MDKASPPASPGELLRVLREFAAGRETASGLDVDPGDCASDLVALAESISVLTSVLAAEMVRYDRLGVGSPAAVLVQDGHFTRTEAANLRRLGRKLDADLPVTRELLAAGRVGVAQAKAIAALDDRLAESTSPIPVEARRQVEAALADHAVSATTTETAHAAAIARYRIDPETVEQELRDQRDERGITLSNTLNGTRHLHGLLDGPSAAIWEGFLDRTAAPASADDPRTAAARRADAITDALELLQRLTSTPDDRLSQESCDSRSGPEDPGPADLRLPESCTPRSAGRAFQRPATWQTGEDPATGGQAGGFAWRKTSPANLMVIASYDLLTGRPGAEPATLGDGTIIPAETARRYICEAALNRVLLAAGDQNLELGRTTRLFTGSQIKAMIVRDRTCRWRGCEVPAIRCTPHHWRHWSQGGTSDTKNGAMLCAAHHRMVHEDRPRAGGEATGSPASGLRAA